MTYVVTDNCIKCKYMDCVEVCPVDCFYEGDDMLVIHPDECIDCEVCKPECPATAIVPDMQPGLENWLKLNTEYASVWSPSSGSLPPTPKKSTASRASSRVISRRSQVRATEYSQRLNYSVAA